MTRRNFGGIVAANEYVGIRQNVGKRFDRLGPPIAATAAAAATATAAIAVAGCAVASGAGSHLAGLALLTVACRRFVIVLGSRIVASRCDVVARSATTSPATATTLGPFGANAVVVSVLVHIVVGTRQFVVIDDRNDGRNRRHDDRVRWRRTGGVEDKVRPHQRLVGDRFDIDAVTLFELDDIGALAIEDVHRNLGSGAKLKGVILALDRLRLECPQRRQRRRRDRADIARSVAHRADMRRRLEHAGAQPLAAHLHQPKRADPAELDAGAVILHRLLHRLLDAAIVTADFHVDEIDHDEAGHVAQAELASDLVGGLQIRFVRRFFDAVLARRSP